MSLEEQGAYVLLYCHCWRGYRVPYNVEVLSKMCNCTIEKIERMLPNIMPLFKQVKHDGQQYLICIQAEEERAEQADNRRKRQAAGKKGAEARWGKDDVQPE